MYVRCGAPDLCRVGARFPLEIGLVSPRTDVSFMYRRPLDMYLNCISSVVFGALGRLVSLCIVSLHRHVSLPVPGAFICSVFKPVSIHAAVSTFLNTGRYLTDT